MIDINDPETESGEYLGMLEYEAFLAEGDPEFEAVLPEDDWQAVSLNYTSGTTGTPKGVVYHTRGTYLLATGNVLAWEMPHRPVYLWTLPMFHCNGWCFPWTITMLGGTHVCLRKVTAKNIYNSIAEHHVTHLLWCTDCDEHDQQCARRRAAGIAAQGRNYDCCRAAAPDCYCPNGRSRI